MCCLVLAAGFAANAQFALPSIPVVLTQPHQRAAYLVEHYWDKCDFQSPSLLKTDKEVFEQHFVDFLSIFPHADNAALATGVHNLFEKAAVSRKAYMQLMKWAEKYLYEPNSPMLNEDFYIIFLREFADSKALTDAEKIRPQEQLENALKNRPGDVATDFEFVRDSGVTTSLAKTLGKSLTMLIFYDSECDHCNEIMKGLRQDPILSNMHQMQQLKVIAVCISGSRDIWMNHRETLPNTWTVGYATRAFDEEILYDIRAFPTIYLLDNHRKVILKDTNLQQLLNWFGV